MTRLLLSWRHVAALIVLLSAGAYAQQVSPLRTDALALPPHDWAVRAAQNELADMDFDRSFLRYRIHSVDKRGNLERDLIESRDGTVARLVRKENRALTAEEDAAERSRLQAMLDDPAAFARHIRTDQNGRKQAAAIIKLIPDAMLFTYTTGQPQVSASPGNDIVLDFHPNPQWKPPTLASETLTGLEGRLWIDRGTGHLRRMETDVFRSVNVGFGVFAKIYPGGTLTLDQVPVEDHQDHQEHRWLFAHVVEHITLRALMLKTYREDSDARSEGVTAVPSMSYEEAIQLLLQTPLPR